MKCLVNVAKHDFCLPLLRIISHEEVFELKLLLSSRKFIFTLIFALISVYIYDPIKCIIRIIKTYAYSVFLL